MSPSTTGLELLRAKANGCRRCQLWEERKTVVFGEGPGDARILFLGEAPGRLEDETGLPFCGRSGILLDQLFGDVGIDRSEVFVTSIVKCRPPANRDPKQGEIASCSVWLEQQLDLLQPEFVCTLGNFALRAIRGDRVGITQVHGIPDLRVVNGRKVVLFPLFHPAAALRSTQTRKLLADDLKSLVRLTG
jgi:DNA polymerase